ncbi:MULTISPECIES: DUF3667 domain-containing protein [Chryseobacterium]|uniref:DUF3667 domain-containing protein n=1 Tax=Chryseobacterium sp. R2A-55 TaxID=2744445 RepID=UPI001F320024|nr:DUF3667 domain-containing protein [Chryseobacterium sp. R2A-55]
MEKREKYCKNCCQHLILEQKFCHNCGQRADVHRINYHFLLHEIQHGIFHVDKGILYTIKELFTRPGHTIREYIEGKRQSHFKPALLIMILATVTVLLNHWINGGKYLMGNTVSVNGLDKTGEIQDEKFLKIANSIGENFNIVVTWINAHFAISMLLMVPFFAFAFWVAFRKFRLNFPEWLVISSFVTGQGMVLYIILIVLAKKIANLNSLFFLCLFGLILWTMLQFFNKSGKISIALRTFLALFIYYAIFVGLVLVFIFAIIFQAR